jgi:hypothetical protein
MPGPVQKASVLGSEFQFRHRPMPGNPEAIEIMGNWTDRFIIHRRLPLVGLAAVHRDALDHFTAFLSAVERDPVLKAQYHSFDGAWAPRFVRQSGSEAERADKCSRLDSSHLSKHASGCAIDLNASLFPLGKALAKDDPWWSVVEAAEHAGLVAGARFVHRPDPMHVECGA